MWGGGCGWRKKGRGKEGWSSGPHQCFFFSPLSPSSRSDLWCVCVRAHWECVSTLRTFPDELSQYISAASALWLTLTVTHRASVYVSVRAMACFVPSVFVWMCAIDQVSKTVTASVCMWVVMCECVFERETEKERERDMSVLRQGPLTINLIATRGRREQNFHSHLPLPLCTHTHTHTQGVGQAVEGVWYWQPGGTLFDVGRSEH